MFLFLFLPQIGTCFWRYAFGGIEFGLLFSLWDYADGLARSSCLLCLLVCFYFALFLIFIDVRSFYKWCTLRSPLFPIISWYMKMWPYASFHLENPATLICDDRRCRKCSDAPSSPIELYWPWQLLLLCQDRNIWKKERAPVAWMQMNVEGTITTNSEGPSCSVKIRNFQHVSQLFLCPNFLPPFLSTNT